MDAIAVVDDKEQMRTTVANLIRLELEDLAPEWTVIDTAPLGSLDDYVPWLRENDVRVLVIDEMLRDEVAPDAEAVMYAGHNVAEVVRQRMPNLPQLIVTSVSDAEGLDAAAGEVEAIIKRNDFNARPSLYVERMTRLGTNYVDRFEKELAELNTLSEKIADGNASQEEIDRIDALRVITQSAYPASTLTGLDEWLTSAEQLRDKMSALISKLNKRN